VRGHLGTPAGDRVENAVELGVHSGGIDPPDREHRHGCRTPGVVWPLRGAEPVRAAVFHVKQRGQGRAGLRTAAERAGVDRKTARRSVEAAVAAGLDRDGGPEQLTDELLGAVMAAVRPARRAGHGRAWETLLAEEVRIREWVQADLPLTNIHGKLARHGVVVPYRTLHRFAVERCGFGRRRRTVRVADGEPGVECQLDFGRLGLIPDAVTRRRRTTHALIFTAVYSRHLFVWLSFTETLATVIAGCEVAWAWFGGVFRVLVPDNMSPIIADADPVNPTFTLGWLDYAQARGFGTDPARVRHATDKPRVERVVRYVRENFFRGESFADLAEAQRRSRRGVRPRRGCGCTARTGSARPNCSPPPRHRGWRRSQRGTMTCRSSRPRRWPATVTSRSPRGSTPCPDS
jgi:hypothetical protein